MSLVDTWVPTEAKEEITARFEKMVKRANRVGFPEPSIAWGETHAGGINGPSDDSAAKIMWQHLTIEGQPLKVGDWTLVASIDPLTIENEKVAYFRAVPEATVPEEWRQVDPTICQHCNAIRYRTETFLIRNDDEYKQVGRQCIRDFLGHNPDVIINYTNFIREMADWFDGNIGGGWNGYTNNKFWTPRTVIDVTANVVAYDGFFVSRKKEREAQDRGEFGVTASASTVIDLLTRHDRYGRELQEKYSAAPSERREELVALTTEELNKLTRNEENDWKYNLWAAWNTELIGFKQLGLLVSGILLGVRRSEDMQKEREAYLAAKAGKPVSEWLGEVGQKVTADVTVTGITVINGDYFSSVLVSMLDSRGNVMKWFASNPPDAFVEGATLRVTGTVKKQDEYKGQKQTVLTRCRVAK